MEANAPAGRRRLGVIVPSSNTVAEVDFARASPPDVTVHIARMYLAETTAEAEHRMLRDHLPQAAADLGSAHPEVVVFSCTSAAALLGDRGEEDLVTGLAQTTGARIVSTNAAVASALAPSGRRVAVLTPYVQELTEAIGASLVERGFELGKVLGLGMSDNFAIGQVTPDAIIDIVMTEFEGESFDALFVSCTNFRAMETIPTLEGRLGRQVVSSNDAAFGAAMNLLSAEGAAVGGAP